MKKQELSEMLAKAGIKPTLQKLEICSIIFARHRHFTMDEIFKETNSEYPKVSRATVFNTLNQLAESGLLRTLNVRSNVLVYDSNTGPHDHVVNDATGEITDIQIPEESKKSLLKNIFSANPGLALASANPSIVIRA